MAARRTQLLLISVFINSNATVDRGRYALSDRQRTNDRITMSNCQYADWSTTSRRQLQQQCSTTDDVLRQITASRPPNYTASRKNVPLCHCPYLRQILTNFRKNFHWHTLYKICNKTVTKYPTTTEMRCCTKL